MSFNTLKKCKSLSLEGKKVIAKGGKPSRDSVRGVLEMATGVARVVELAHRLRSTAVGRRDLRGDGRGIEIALLLSTLIHNRPNCDHR